MRPLQVDLRQRNKRICYAFAENSVDQHLFYQKH